MTVMVFQLEGSDETLQEGLRKISQTVDSMIRPSTKSIVARIADAPPLTSETGVGASAGEPSADEVPDDPSDLEGASGEAPEKRKRYQERSPKVVEFDTSKASIPLPQYCQQKNAGESTNRRYLVILLWLKEQLGIQEATMDHVHTCYKLLGWPTPAVAGQPLRQLKHEGFLGKGEGKGAYRINHIGENEVNTTT